MSRPDFRPREAYPPGACFGHAHSAFHRKQAVLIRPQANELSDAKRLGAQRIDLDQRFGILAERDLDSPRRTDAVNAPDHTLEPMVAAARHDRQVVRTRK